MDNKQAIEELKQIKQNHIELNYRFRHLYDDYIIAVDKAIASLEAWDEVIEEIEQEFKEYDNVLTDLDYSTGLGYALAVIEEHLKEIEE